MSKRHDGRAGRPGGRSGGRPQRPVHAAHPLQGKVFEFDIERLALGGAGVARMPEAAGEQCAGMTVFVAGALPGARVRARIDAVRRRHAEATAVETLTPSPDEVEPLCPHFTVCGGCPLQNLDPARQLEWKRRQILDVLARIGKVTPGSVLPAVPAQALAGFRNKMEFAFQGLGASLRLGLYAKADPGRVFDVEACAIFPEAGMPVLAAVRAACREAGLSAYDRRAGQGLLRHLVLRHSVLQNRLLAQLITAPVPADSAPAAAIRAMGEDLLRRFPVLSGFVHAERAAADGLAQAERTALALGEPALAESLEEARYVVGADSFFQTNTAGALALYSAVRGLAAPTAADTVFDLYCGGGGIALFLAQSSPGPARVLGLEANPAAVADAEANARLNGFAPSLCRFLRADLAGEHPAPERLPDGFAKPDVVVADPPREGLDAGVAAWLNDLRPSRLVYVSCNPATLARDAGLLAGPEGRFRLTALRVVDLFPHTAHAECVGLFEPA